MTAGERMIYAAVFAREYRDLLREGPPKDIVPFDGDANAEWLRDGTVNAAWMACETVRAFRQSMPGIDKRFGRDSDVWEMAVEMNTRGTGSPW